MGKKIRIADFLADDVSGKGSSTKLWMHIAYGMLTWAVYKHMQTGQLTYDIIMAYGGLVGCHQVLIYWLKRKYAVGGGEALDGFQYSDAKTDIDADGSNKCVLCGALPRHHTDGGRSGKRAKGSAKNEG